ncbi:MAG: glycosyltransferase family 39 protein, partial [Thermoanaerobaculum sp.]|nr:glycosyltransferase family 39 protein [Thermoanaerobaculum sp.]
MIRVIPPLLRAFLPFLAFALGLAGQWLLAPPTRSVVWAVPLLAVAIILWLLAVPGEDLGPTAKPGPWAPLRMRWAAVGASAALALVAWPLFRDNRFTAENTLLWLAAVALGSWGFWGRERGEPVAVQRREALGFFLVFLLVAVFRLAHLPTVPAHPFSDHAEKLEDVWDVTEGQLRVFFPRNTGREAFQFYWTWLVGKLFGTGVSFLSLKLGTALLGLGAVVFVYFLGRFLGGHPLGLLAMLFFGLAYWPNVISRIGLRFPLYPLFAAAVLYLLFRALHTGRQRDWVLTGLALGLGLHGYTPFRVMPLVVAVLVLLFWLCHRRQLPWKAVILRSVVVAAVAFLVFLPLASVAWSRPQEFWYRAATRFASLERSVEGNPWAVFSANVGRALAMFNYDDGDLFAISIPHRPALDRVSGALFLLGVAMAAASLFRRQNFWALALLLSIPLLQLPSTLSLAFPHENPAPNRAGAAAIPALVLAAWAGLVLWRKAASLAKPAFWVVSGALLVAGGGAAYENWHLVLSQFAQSSRLHHWDTQAVGEVVRRFLREGGSIERVWIVRVPHWMDTRLPALAAGIPHRDLGLDRDQIPWVLRQPGR